VLKNSILSLFWVAQRFTAAISVLFSILALATEGDCHVQKEFLALLTPASLATRFSTC
jgi:hypothetical protein